MTSDALQALFGKADYSHIAREATVTVKITAAEMAAVLGAYDRGLNAPDQDEREDAGPCFHSSGLVSDDGLQREAEFAAASL